MKVMPIVYVSDMGRAIDFYTALGFSGAVEDRAQMWTELKMGDAILGLHFANPLPKNSGGRMELAFVSDEALEGLVSRLEAAGITLERQITDESFGRSIAVCDPDGMLLQINEHDESLYT
jgi:catechol 2,3-dioxygenase-like lactoylglutathione lyase family enzyme